MTVIPLQVAAALGLLSKTATVDAGALQVRADGRLVTLTVGSVTDLDAWYDGESLTVSSRPGVGGMTWSAGLGQVAPGVWLEVVATSEELEVLPDLLVVRHGAPWASKHRAAAGAVAA